MEFLDGPGLELADHRPQRTARRSSAANSPSGRRGDTKPSTRRATSIATFARGTSWSTPRRLPDADRFWPDGARHPEDSCSPATAPARPTTWRPELVKRQPTDQRLDIFAFGVERLRDLHVRAPWERGDTGLVAMKHAEHAPVEIEVPPSDSSQAGRRDPQGHRAEPRQALRHDEGLFEGHRRGGDGRRVSKAAG